MGGGGAPRSKRNRASITSGKLLGQRRQDRVLADGQLPYNPTFEPRVVLPRSRAVFFLFFNVHSSDLPPDLLTGAAAASEQGTTKQGAVGRTAVEQGTAEQGTSQPGPCLEQTGV